jgi:hypothetical protein
LKNTYWITLVAAIVFVLGSVAYVKAPKSAPQAMAHTPEYDAVVDQHIDTSKISRNEIDLSVIKQEVSQRFVAYQFNHPMLRGKWGDLHVFLDRQTGKSISRSLWPVKNNLPEITLATGTECLMVNQPGQNNYEICIR